MEKTQEVNKVIFIIDNYLKELFESIGFSFKETDIGLEISVLLDSEELEEKFSKNSEDFCSNVFSREIGEGCFTFKIVKVTQDELNEYHSNKEFSQIMEKEYDDEWKLNPNEYKGLIEWTLNENGHNIFANENGHNIFEFPKGMYFIGDLTTYLYMDVGGDNTSFGEIFNKKKISDLDKRVEIYKDAHTGIYTECLGGDGCFEDKDGYSYPIDSGTIGICRVDNKLIENITSNSESCTCMIFYKKIILKVEKDEVKSFKPRDLSVLRDLGRFIYFKDNFNVEFKLLQNNEGIESIQFGEIKIDISNKEYSEMEEITEEWIIKKMTKREEQEKKEGWISIEDLERE